MRLSEAIRLGAMLKPQAFGYWFDPSSGGTCAIGAAADAVGLINTARPETNYIAVELKERVPVQWKRVCDTPAHCPRCGCAWERPRGHDRDVQGVIVHLNNAHRWTREEIADWVAGVEAAQEIGPPETDDAVRLSVEPSGVPLRASV